MGPGEDLLHYWPRCNRLQSIIGKFWETLDDSPAKG